MGAVMRVDTRALRQARPAVDDVAAELDGALRQLDSGLDAEGRCWGDDEAGQSFAAAYVPALDQLRRSLATLQTGVSHVAQVLDTVADRVDAADARAGARLS
jgi:uncharacterized protein YukE